MLDASAAMAQTKTRHGTADGHYFKIIIDTYEFLYTNLLILLLIIIIIEIYFNLLDSTCLLITIQFYP